MQSLDAPTHPEHAALDRQTTGTPKPDVRTPSAPVQPDRVPWPSTATSSALAAAALRACGGGDDNTSNNPPAKPTETEAARFLMQASFGGTYVQVEEVVTKGFEAWLDAELAKPRIYRQQTMRLTAKTLWGKAVYCLQLRWTNLQRRLPAGWALENPI